MAEMWQNFLMQESGINDNESNDSTELSGNAHIAEIKPIKATSSTLLGQNTGGISRSYSGDSTSSAGETSKTAHLRSYAPANFTTQHPPASDANESSQASSQSQQHTNVSSIQPQGFASIMNTINSQTSSKTLHNINLNNQQSSSANPNPNTNPGSSGVPPNIVNPDLAITTGTGGVSRSSTTSSVMSDHSSTTTPPSSPFQTGFNLLPESPIFSPNNAK